MTINHCYWEQDCKHHHARQAEKKALESHSQKQGKASIFVPAIVFQNKTNSFLAASSTKIFSFKLSPSPTPKKQSNSPWVNLSFKLVSNSRLTSDKHKKHLENNLCLYCGVGDYKLDSCSKKQTTVISKGHDASATASEKPSKK